MHWRTYGRWLDRVEQEQERWIGFSHDLLRRLRPGWEPPKRLTYKQELELRLRQLRREASFRTTTEAVEKRICRGRRADVRSQISAGSAS